MELSPLPKDIELVEGNSRLPMRRDFGSGVTLKRAKPSITRKGFKEEKV